MVPAVPHPKGWYEGRVRKTVAIPPGQTPMPGDVVDGFQGCLLEGGRMPPTPPERLRRRRLPCLPSRDGAGSARAAADERQCRYLAGRRGLRRLGEPRRRGPYSYPHELPPPGGSTTRRMHGNSPPCTATAPCAAVVMMSSPTLASGRSGPDPGQWHSAGSGHRACLPVERTYSEWRHSAYASTVFRDGMEPGGDAVPGKVVPRTEHCQHCHMRQVEAPPWDPRHR